MMTQRFSDLDLPTLIGIERATRKVASPDSVTLRMLRREIEAKRRALALSQASQDGEAAK